jgi:hypothetical protein
VKDHLKSRNEPSEYNMINLELCEEITWSECGHMVVRNGLYEKILEIRIERGMKWKSGYQIMKDFDNTLNDYQK